MADDDFKLWLGRVGQDRPLAHRMRAAINRAGGIGARKCSAFTGARIGRGNGIGAMLGSADYRRGATMRRVIVKARIVKLAGKGLSGAAAHLHYLQRDGTTRDGERGELYGADDAPIDSKSFLERGRGDRHQFRFIVAPEDGAEYVDLKPLIRRWVATIEQDLGTGLDWVAVDHFNTGHPHSHVIVRGKDDRGKDLIIARNYLTEGLRVRAAELVDIDLGPRSAQEILRAANREIVQDRFIGIDRRLVAAVGPDGTVRAVHANTVEQSLRAGRLQMLGRMGLATEAPRGVWRLAAELEPVLRRMGERNDIVRTLQRELRERLPERAAADHAIYEPDKATSPIVGKVVARGIADEHEDRHYLIVDGIDGLSHYVDIGTAASDTTTGNIVRVAPTPIAVRPVDRTIAEVAALNGGRYDIDAHLVHDPSATDAFAETHVRRLEAIRKASDAVVREPDGSWTIAPDHLARVEVYERARARAAPVIVETLSARPIDRQTWHDGPTWLDRELVAAQPAELGRGFGADVRQALVLRQQWLIEQDLAELDGHTIRYRGDVLTTLQQRELGRVAAQLSGELGTNFTEARIGQTVTGVLRRAVAVGDTKFAVIERARDFSLVPWRPVLDRSVGQPVSGIVRGGSISWTIGRQRTGPEIGGL